MPWNDQQADRYEQWFATPLGRFVLDQESRLLQRLVASWPRRRQGLLDVGCGAGHFSHKFWEWGFEVSGVDPSPAMLRLARKRMGEGSDLRVGVAEHLPYNDNDFDFVSLITVLEFCEEPELALAEAMRVARKGVIIGFLNRHSLYYLTHVRFRTEDKDSLWADSTWLSWWEMQRLIHTSIGKPWMLARSVLAGPVWTWRQWPLFKGFCGMLLPPFIGSFAAVRVDLLRQPAKTPLLAWKTEPSL
ncbi:MAG: methyltransferase type 11 [Deltaproteobacteria bacterium]|nr:MAG: methyltransferase type 11 [Deltaproteobacteria bacterium]